MRNRSRVWTHMRQETQLSKTDRATLHVTEYFTKSLKIIRNDTAE